MTEEPNEELPIYVRQGADSKEEEEEKKKGGAALPAGRSGGPGLIRGAPGGAGAGQGVVGVSAPASASVRAGGLLGRLANPFRSLSGFLRQMFALGPVEGLKFALRNVLVQGLVAGLLFAVGVNFLLGPQAPGGKKGPGGIPFPQAGPVSAPEARNEGLFGSIPGIWKRAVDSLKGEEAPAEGVAENKDGATAAAPESAAPTEAAPAAPGEPADASEAGSGRAGSGVGKLEKMQGLFGSGSGGSSGSGAGTLASLPTGSAGRAGAGAAAGDLARAKTGTAEAMKGRGKTPIRGGSRQGLIGARDARDQLKTAKAASQLGAGAASPQAGAAMAAMPFDGAAVSGPGASSVPGGPIVPLPGSPGSPGGGPGPSPNGGGNEIPRDPDDNPRDPPGGPDGPDGPDGPEVPRIGPERNTTPYQRKLDRALSLIGQAHELQREAKTWRNWGIALIAIGALLMWGGRGLGRGRQVAGQVATETAGAAKAAEVVGIQLSDGSSVVAQGGASEKSGAANLLAILLGKRGGDIAQAGGGPGFGMVMGGIIAGLGITLITMSMTKGGEIRDKLSEAQDIAAEINETYLQTPQADIIQNATDRQCTKDGRPRMQDSERCGYDPRLVQANIRDREAVTSLQDYLRCMTQPVCRNPGNTTGNRQ